MPRCGKFRELDVMLEVEAARSYGSDVAASVFMDLANDPSIRVNHSVWGRSMEMNDSAFSGAH